MWSIREVIYQGFKGLKRIIIFNENNPFDKMAQILNVGRLITLECAILNPMNWKEIAFELNDEVQMMKPEGFNENILINIWPENNHKYQKL